MVFRIPQTRSCAIASLLKHANLLRVLRRRDVIASFSQLPNIRGIRLSKRDNIRNIHSSCAHYCTEPSQIAQDEPYSNFSLHVIHISGIPFSVTEEQMQNYFSGVVGVHLIRNSVGQASGRCFIEFDSEQSKRTSLLKDGEWMGTRYLKITETNPEDLCRNVEWNESLPDLSKSIVLRGFLSGTTEPDVRAFLQTNSLSPISVRQSKPGTWALCEFDECEIVEAALAMGKQYFGDRYIDIARADVGFPQKEFDFSRSSGMMVLVEGLDFRMKEDDIAEFFSDISTPTSIDIQQGTDGRPTGLAKVGFSTIEAAKQAIQLKNRTYLGRRYVNLKLWQGNQYPSETRYAEITRNW
eukprot:470434_1